MKETIALAVPIYESVKAPAYRSHLAMVAAMARMDVDLWLLHPRYERRTYPFCVNDMVAAMLAAEKSKGRRADWLFYVEDDIVTSPDTFAKLRAAADPQARPFVSALTYCRTPPYGPGVANIVTQNGLVYADQWRTAPIAGTHPADQVGMCACVIHRSLFNRIAEPWFEIYADLGHSSGPDASWCGKLRTAGIAPQVCCDAEVGHLDTGRVITRADSEVAQ